LCLCVKFFTHTHALLSNKDENVGPCENLNQRQERIGIGIGNGNGKKKRKEERGRDPFVKFTFDWHQK
jgi:hypothetical protein